MRTSLVWPDLEGKLLTEKAKSHTIVLGTSQTRVLSLLRGFITLIWTARGCNPPHAAEDGEKACADES